MLIQLKQKHSIPDLVVPELNGFKLKISESAKYLGIVLDRKLHWNLNYADIINNATVALFACKKAMGKRWGFNPKIIYWICTAIVLYRVLVWWTAMNKVTIQISKDSKKRLTLH